VKCDVCDKEFSNSEELKRHQEEAHPMDELETPDMDPENPEVKREIADSKPAEMPTPLDR
jgi:Zinc finger, C2H2 type